MSDADLEAIRAQRMAQLQQQMGRGGGENAEQHEQRQKQQEQVEVMKQTILSQVLTQEAKARLSAISMAKPEKAEQIEGMLVQMAQSGRIQGKLGEGQLKELLQQFNQQTSKTTTVKFDRRRAAFDSDDDDY